MFTASSGGGYGSNLLESLLTDNLDIGLMSMPLKDLGQSREEKLSSDEKGRGKEDDSSLDHGVSMKSQGERSSQSQWQTKYEVRGRRENSFLLIPHFHMSKFILMRGILSINIGPHH